MTTLWGSVTHRILTNAIDLLRVMVVPSNPPTATPISVRTCLCTEVMASPAIAGSWWTCGSMPVVSWVGGGTIVTHDMIWSLWGTGLRNARVVVSSVMRADIGWRSL